MNGVCMVKGWKVGMAAMFAVLMLVPMLSAQTMAAQTVSTDAQTASSNASWSATGIVSCSSLVDHLRSCTRFDTRQSCTLRCLEAGGKFVLRVGEQSYRLAGGGAHLKEFAGGRARITGIAVGDVMEVTSVAKAR
jgi:hypothetical protein